MEGARSELLAARHGRRLSSAQLPDSGPKPAFGAFALPSKRREFKCLPYNLCVAQSNLLHCDISPIIAPRGMEGSEATMSTTWKTKYGPRRVRHDPPTLEEAIF